MCSPWGVNDPTEGSRQTVSDPWDAVADPFTWLGDGSATYNTTRGNNGIAQSNPDGGFDYLNNYRPVSADLDFSYPYETSMTPPSKYVDASATQLFYTANMYHDVLYALGFNEAAGNFETNNNGKGGKGGDFVILSAQDGAGTDNADFATPPDGQNPRMRMYIWTYSTPNRDCCFESGVVLHEYTHGREPPAPFSPPPPPFFLAVGPVARLTDRSVQPAHRGPRKFQLPQRARIGRHGRRLGRFHGDGRPTQDGRHGGDRLRHGRMGLR